jgi:hypothetical protein
MGREEAAYTAIFPSTLATAASTLNCLAYEAGAEALPLWEEIWPGPAMKLEHLRF